MEDKYCRTVPNTGKQHCGTPINFEFVHSTKICCRGIAKPLSAVMTLLYPYESISESFACPMATLKIDPLFLCHISVNLTK